MDSGVSEVSTVPMFPGLQAGPGVNDGQPARRVSRKQKQVKRQASELSGSDELLQSMECRTEQQAGWLQLWPASYQLPCNLQPDAAFAAWPSACMSFDHVAAQQGQAAAPGWQPHQQYAPAAFIQGYSHHPAAAAAAAAPVCYPGAAYAATRPAPAAVQGTAMLQGISHRLPKRRASAPHLLSQVQQGHPVVPTYKCVPHAAGPNCQCTQCLCARTDELCRRLIAQRSTQTTTADGAAGPGSPAAAPAAGMPPAMYMQHVQPQQQVPQGQQRPGERALSQSSLCGKRRSFEVLPLAHNLKLPVLQSPSSSRQHSPASSQQPSPPGQQQRQLQPQQMAGTKAAGAMSSLAGYQPVLTGLAAAGPACGTSLRSSASSGQLQGRFQALTVDANPFRAAAAVATTAASLGTSPGMQLQAMPNAEAVDSGLLLHAGSSQSVFGGAESGAAAGADDAAVELELEQLLAEAGWPLEGPSPGHAQDMSVASGHAAVLQMPGGAVAPAAQQCLTTAPAPWELAAAAAHLHQQQPAASSGAAAVPSCAPAAPCGDGWGAVLRQPSFTGWAAVAGADAGLAPGQGLEAGAGIDAAECALLEELLAGSPEEAAFVGLLPN